MKLSKNIIRDNVHLDIYVSDFVFDLIDTPEFQRLRRIKQLGGAYLVYPGANHTRFQHSIGVMHNVTTIINENKTHKFSKCQIKLLQAAAILHDIGHGPFSHLFEDISRGNIDHEKMGRRIILSPITEVNKILRKHKIKPQDVVNMFDKKKSLIFSQILSSHIDADRMDYLIRDAIHTGTNYGLIDKDKLIKSMDLSGKEIIFSYSALPAIESFLFARYQAFRSVYLHRIGLIYQEMIKVLLDRLYELRKHKEYKSFYEKLSVIWDKKTDIKKYLELDDEVFNTIIFDFSKTSDKIIVDFATRIRKRDFFEARTKCNNQKVSDIKIKLKNKNYNPKYYFIKTKIKKHPYSITKNDSIKIRDKYGKVVFLEKLSSLIKNLSSHEFSESYVILPKGILK